MHEAELDRDYHRFTESKSLRFNLAYAEGFEAFTCALACFSLQTASFDRMHPAVRELFAWHLMEEIEHRTVAFDVYEHVVGGYLYRLVVGLFAQWHLHRFVLRVAKALREADPRAFREFFLGQVRGTPGDAEQFGQIRGQPAQSHPVEAAFSAPIVVLSPWPVRTSVLSGNAKSLSWMDFTIVG